MTATASIPPAGEVTMTDSFGASIEGYRDWLLYGGKRKGASTIRQYAKAAALGRPAHGDPQLVCAMLALVMTPLLT